MSKKIIWKFDEDETNDIYPIDVIFKPLNTVGGYMRIPIKYFTDYNNIPTEYIKHGNIFYDIKYPIQIVNKYKEFNIVRYTDKEGKEVRLGFLDEDLIKK